MSDPISRPLAGSSPSAPAALSASGSARRPDPSRFADALRSVRQSHENAPRESEAPAIGELAIRGAVASIARGEQLVQGVVRAAQRGATFTNEQLIAIQAGVYRYTQELELASKLVDKATGAVRQTLQSQQ